MEILVTGANRGIGAALLDGYAALGIPAMGTSRDGAVGLMLDVTDPDSISELGRHYAERRLDLLVCNAAVFLDRGRSLEELSAEDWARTMAVNVTGVAETVRVLLPALRRSRCPRQCPHHAGPGRGSARNSEPQPSKPGIRSYPHERALGTPSERR